MNIAYNVDCMEYMRTLPDKAFDLAVVDPPYGIGISENPVRQAHKAKNGTTKLQILIILKNFLGLAKIKLYGEETILNYLHIRIF